MPFRGRRTGTFTTEAPVRLVVVLENPPPEAFEALFREHRFVVVDFYATWCGPCKAYSPKFARAYRELRRQYPSLPAAFVSVDVDRDHALARRHGVKGVPTTVVLTERKSWFGRTKRVEALRFSGDRPWNELLRMLLDVVSS